jgi:hypothetical protein
MQRQPGQIVHETLPQEKKSCKRAGGVAESVDPAFKPSTTKKRKKKKKKKAPRRVCCSTWQVNARILVLISLPKCPYVRHIDTPNDNVAHNT